MTPVRYLAVSAVAKRLGIAPITIYGYIKKGLFPAPDAILDDGTRRPRGWLPETIDAWSAQRPRKPRVTPPPHTDD
jgi:predicted DNA-binding transcriptional regulator AlpA